MTPRAWIAAHKWRMLLLGIVGLLVVSPISRIFDRADPIITPVVALVLILVICGVAERREIVWVLSALTLVWGLIGFFTEGSGLFAGISFLAPVIFLFVLVAIFVLLARWMIRATQIGVEVLCAAVCGYLLLGILWAVLYSISLTVRHTWFPEHPSAFISSIDPELDHGDLLYFSYMTLTTTGYGDIVPRGSEVRMLAVIEAMAGLFYNTIIIARFVGLYGIRPRAVSADE
jgi:hypothetical protein